MFEYLYGINDSWTSLTGDYDPNESEDCLFLDIVVPKPVFNGADQGRQAPVSANNVLYIQHSHNTQVLVWIYGGGFTTGSKSGSASGPVDGLLRRGNNNFVFVDINYRLGAFGWLSGPTFQEDGTANLGLLDQRFALEWVQKYIHLFGGDPDNVTVMGESSGGGSVLHQITVCTLSLLICHSNSCSRPTEVKAMLPFTAPSSNPPAPPQFSPTPSKKQHSRPSSRFSTSPHSQKPVRFPHPSSSPPTQHK